MRFGYLASYFGAMPDLTAYYSPPSPIVPIPQAADERSGLNPNNANDGIAGKMGCSDFFSSYQAAQGLEPVVNSIRGEPEGQNIAGQWDSYAAQLDQALRQVGQYFRWDVYAVGIAVDRSHQQTANLQATYQTACSAVHALANMGPQIAQAQAAVQARVLAASQVQTQHDVTVSAVDASVQAKAQAQQAQDELAALQAQQALQAAQNPTPWGWIIGGLAAAGAALFALTRRRAPPSE